MSFITKINIGNICFSSISPEVSYKKGALRNFAKFIGEHLYQILFFNKVAGWTKKEEKKEALAQVFSCDFGKNSKKIFSYRTPPVAAFDVSLYNIYMNTKHERVHLVPIISSARISRLVQSRYAVVSNARFDHQDHLGFVKHLINVLMICLKRFILLIVDGWLLISYGVA